MYKSYSIHQKLKCATPMLTEQQAINIYHIKLRHLEDQKCKLSLRGMSGPVSKTYGVSARTIRDIWNRKTWTFATDQDSTTASVNPAIQADIQFRKLMCDADFFSVCAEHKKGRAPKRSPRLQATQQNAASRPKTNRQHVKEISPYPIL